MNSIKNTVKAHTFVRPVIYHCFKASINMKVVAVGLVLPNPFLIMSVPSLMIQLESLEPNIIASVVADIKDMAGKGVSEQTIRYHLKGLFRKVGVDSQRELLHQLRIAAELCS